MNKKKRKMKKAPFLPLIIFLITVGYGCLRLDFSDASGGESYGWLYFFLGLIPVTICYMVSICLNLVNGFRLSKKLSMKTDWRQLSFVSYCTSLVVVTLLLIVDWFGILMPVETYTQVGTLAFAVAACLLAYFGWQAATTSVTIELSERKLPIKSIIIGVLIPVTVICALVGPKVLWDVHHDFQTEKAFKTILTEQLGKIGTKGEIEIINYYEDSGYVDYTLTEGDQAIYGKAIMGTKAGDWYLKESSIGSYQQSFTSFLQIPGQSKEAEKLLRAVKKEVARSLVEAGLEKDLKVSQLEIESGNLSSSYDNLYLSYIYQPIPKEIEKQAEKNREAQGKKGYFSGYTALTVEELMASQTINLSIPLELENWELEEELIASFYQKLQDAFDFSALTDGCYEVTIGRTSRNWVVTNHQVSTETESKGQRKLTHPKDDLGSFSPGSYFSW